ncbi:MAG: DNA polymerase IV, partial [Eubacteriales bacterium]|nr:DNA polymerase IV [Eubacteriales bacterium]
MDDRWILHCDMNNFYAGVECLHNPELRGKPVAVCGSAEKRKGIVLAKNYPAKAFGVRTGEAVWEARQKCKDLIIQPPHYDLYMKYSALARAVYGRYTDRIESMGADECWLDITGSLLYFGKTPCELAYEIKETIKNELGLTVSVGVSFNKIFAKLGSDMKKPDAVTVIVRENFRDTVWLLPVSDMLGVGSATKRKLSEMAVKTIGDLAEIPCVFLEKKFGVIGNILWLFANGLDNSAVTDCTFSFPVKSVGHGSNALTD